MPFLALTSGTRKKKSYIHDDAEESAKRREMIKQKLYAEHMIDDEEEDYYLERQLSSKSTARRVSPGPLSRSHSNDRLRVPANPNYIDPSGSLRKPPRRSISESTGRPGHTMQRVSPRHPPRRTRSIDSPLSSPNPVTPPSNRNPRFSMAPHPTGRRCSPPQISPLERASSRRGGNFHNDDIDESDEEDDGGEFGEEIVTPLSQRRPPTRRRRATVASQSIQKSAEAAMRFGPPRRVKSYYPGGMTPRNTLRLDHNHSPPSGKGSLDSSDHSYVSKDSSTKGGRRGKGLFRHRSGDSNATEDTASSSDKSSSFFRKVKRSNSFLKKNSSLNTSEHSYESHKSHKSQKSWYTSGGTSQNSGGARSANVDQDPNKNAQNYLQNSTIAGRNTLAEQLSRLPQSDDSDDEYDEIDDETESKSIFSSIIQKIEDIYDDCS